MGRCFSFLKRPILSCFVMESLATGGDPDPWPLLWGHWNQSSRAGSCNCLGQSVTEAFVAADLSRHPVSEWF